MYTSGSGAWGFAPRKFLVCASCSILKMPGESSCPACSRKVAKSAKALKCSYCREWYHVACLELEESDHQFMSKRMKFGFRWYCPDCVIDADDTISRKAASGEIEKKFQNIESLVSASMLKLGERLDHLEQKYESASPSPQVSNAQPENFAEIVKRALNEEKNPGVVVNDRGHSRTVENQNVLVVKPKIPDTNMNSADMADSVTKIEEALKEIPVSSCKETKSGKLVMKFPNEAAKKEASRVVDNCLGPDHTMHVTESKKMLPKMTVPDVSLFMNDEEIVQSITRKNPNIQKLVNEGCALSLVFARTKENSKTAVLKMAPEIRSEIIKDGNYIFVGMKRCKAYDRFWVSQCYHCQGFEHTSPSCPKKNSNPVCAFCSDAHESKSCTKKDSPQCANCLQLENRSTPTNHFASYASCPVMVSQRQKVIQNTNFTSSKNA